MTVRLFTGATGVTSDWDSLTSSERQDQETTVPVWYIGPADDDLLAAGGVYDRQQGAVVSPQNGVDTTVNGVDEYVKGETYSTVVTLPAGDYRLWHGTQVYTQQIQTDWEGVK